MAFLPQGLGGAMGGLAQAMGGKAGIVNGLSTMSPLLMAMSASLRSGEGAAAGLPTGMLMMQQQQKQRKEMADEEAAKQAAAEAAALYGGGIGGGYSGTPAAMGARDMPPASPIQNAMTGSAPAGYGMTPGQGDFAELQNRPAPKFKAPEVQRGVLAALTEEGIPIHIAHGFMGNLAQESGFNPTAYNAKEDAFGLAQWRGDRLNGLRQFAADQGKEASDPIVQAKYIAHELKTTEAGAWSKIQGTKTLDEATAAIDRHYERSSGEHLGARLQNSRELARLWGDEYGIAKSVSPMDHPRARTVLATIGHNGTTSALRAQAEAEWEMIKQWAQDQGQQGLTPYQAAQLGQADVRMAQDAQVSPEDRYRAVGGTLVDLYGQGGPQPVIRDAQGDPAAITTLRIRAAEAGLKPGTPEYQQFMANGGSGGGMALSVGPNGEVSFTQGAATVGKPLTEAQSRDNFLGTRMQGAIPDIDAYEGALTSFWQNLTKLDPTGVARVMQSEEYQVAENAALELVNAALRKDTGAAALPSEEATMNRLMIPAYGDKDALLVRKKAVRKRVIDAIKSGMSKEQIMSTAVAAFGGGEPEATPLTSPTADPAQIPQSAIDSGIDPDLWQYMDEGQRALWQ